MRSALSLTALLTLVVCLFTASAAMCKETASTDGFVVPDDIDAPAPGSNEPQIRSIPEDDIIVTVYKTNGMWAHGKDAREKTIFGDTFLLLNRLEDGVLIRIRQDEIDEVVRQYPNSEPARVADHFGFGVRYFKSGNMHQAYREFSKVLSLTPDNQSAKTYIDQIMAHQAQKKADEKKSADSPEMWTRKLETIGLRDDQVEYLLGLVSEYDVKMTLLLQHLTDLYIEDVKAALAERKGGEKVTALEGKLLPKPSQGADAQTVASTE